MADKDNKRFRPMHGYALCKRILPDKTEGGIIVPETAQEGMVTRWKVIAASEGHIKDGVAIPCTLQPGEEVVVVPHMKTGIDQKTKQPVVQSVIEALRRPDMPEEHFFVALADICGACSAAKGMH